MKQISIFSEVTENGCRLVLRDKETREALESLVIQQAETQHRNFILSTWVKSYAHFGRRMYVSVGSHDRVHVPEQYYISGENALAEASWAECKVVTDPKGYTVYAWVCAAPGKLWHAYTVPELRKNGIFKALVREVCGDGEIQVARILPKMPKNWKYNPYMLGTGAQGVKSG